MTKITNTYVLDKAKMSVLLLIMLFTCPLAFAQSEPETAKPLTDMEVVRKVAFLDIEGKYYEDVTMSFKSITPDYFISDKYKVKVKVVDKNGKSIYKKTLKNVFLYACVTAWVSMTVLSEDYALSRMLPLKVNSTLRSSTKVLKPSVLSAPSRRMKTENSISILTEFHT